MGFCFASQSLFPPALETLHQPATYDSMHLVVNVTMALTLVLHLLVALGGYLRYGGEVPANWKFLTHVTLDDYHIVAVHPSTFGANGYLKAKEVTYARFGRHSAYTPEPGDDPLAGVLADWYGGTRP